MKRLLAYLFIVLGLGLVVSVNANAKYLELCWKTLSGDEVWVTKNKAWKRGGSGCKNIHKRSDSKLYKEVVKNLNKTNRSDGTNKIYSIKKVNLEGILHNHNKNWDDWLYKEGCIEGNCINGQGTYTWTDGRKYVGKFKDGKKNGQGTYTYSSGGKYVGEWKDNRFHGQGTLTFADGKIKKGIWINSKLFKGTCIKGDCINGQGTHLFTNGAKYVGEFKDREKHGQGTFTFADGRITKGIWKNNKFFKGTTSQTQIAKTEPSQTQKWTIKNIKELEKAVHDQRENENKLFSLYKKYAFNINDLIKADKVYKMLEPSEGRALLYQRLLLTKEKEDEIVGTALLLKESFINDGLHNAFVFELSKILKNIKVPPPKYLAFYKNNINPKITQIAKAEPSQTQEVVKEEGCIEGNCINGYGTFVDTNGDKYIGEFRNSIFHGQGTYTSESGYIVKYVGEYKYGFRDGQGTSTNKFGGTENGIWNNNVFVKRNNIKTQIAKAEPSQTQEVAKKVSLKNSLTLSEEDALKAQIFGCWSIPLSLPSDKNLLVRIKLKLKPDGSILSTQILDHENIKEGYYKVLSESALRALKLCQPLRLPANKFENWKELTLNMDVREVFDLPPLPDTEIAKSFPSQTQEVAEPTIKPKKKVKVAKVEEPKQEEFKPENKDIDNDAPIIQIAEAITVDSQAYTLKGKVKDKSQIYLTIDGRQVQVKKGKFKVDRFNIDPEEVEEIKIVAIDKWNNKTEKTIKVTIDLQSTELARSFEDLKPNSVRVKTDKNKIAIIIGIEKYENLTNLDAKYANRDAQAFRTYATKALGIKPSNIKVLIDDKANRGNTLEAFKLWLPKIANNDGKDIYVFFAGHGLASENGEDLYILPQDGNAKLLDDTAITRVELISLIQKVNPKSVTMFFDTCYSGQTRDERMLVASLLRPIRIVAEEQDTPDNFTIFSASNFDQASGGIEEAKHGMFSYYLMKGLEGKADNNKDKQITNGELIAYLKTNVSKEAFTQNREQDPMLSGDPDKVLMSYR